MLYYEIKNIDDQNQLSAAENNVRNYLGLVDYPFVDDFTNDYIKVMKDTASMLNSFNDKQFENWRDAAKRHKDHIAELTTKLMLISKDFKIANPIKEVYRSSIIFTNGESIEEMKIKPRSFWKFYKLIRYIGFCQDADQAVCIMQHIVTLFSIYKDIRVIGPLRDQRTEAHIHDMTSTSNKESVIIDPCHSGSPLISESEEGRKIISNRSILEYFHQRLDYYDECFEKDVEPDTPTGRELFRTIKKIIGPTGVFQRPDMSPRTLLMSLSSVGCKRPLTYTDKIAYKENLKSMTHPGGSKHNPESDDYTVPSMIAAAFEEKIDYKYKDQFLKITGLLDPDPLDNHFNFKFEDGNYCVAIEHRSKDDVRTIHIGSNRINDALHYFSLLHQRYIRTMKSMAMYDQMGAVRSITTWFRGKHKCTACYSMDLTSATDTLDRNEQAILLDHYLKWIGYTEEERTVLVSVWLELMSKEVTVKFPDSKKTRTIRMATGQPMGFEDSVMSLNYCHDIWVILLIDMLLSEDPDLEYKARKILGDDFVAAFEADPNNVFVSNYTQLMAELNTYTNKTKGYVYNVNDPDENYHIPLAEFAKNLICDGENISPLPLGAMFKGHTLEQQLGYLRWILDRKPYNHFKFDTFLNMIEDKYKDMILLSCLSTIKNNISSLLLPKNDLTIRPEDEKLRLAINLVYAKNLTLFATCCKIKLRSEGDNSDRNGLEFSYKNFKGNWRTWARWILEHDESRDHKLTALHDYLSDCIVAQDLVLTECMSGMRWLSTEDIDDLVDFIPEIISLGTVDIEEFIKIVELLTNHAYEDISSAECEEININLSNFYTKCDILNCNRKYKQQQKASSNLESNVFDLQKLLDQVKENMSLLGVTEDEYRNTLEYVHSQLSYRCGKQQLWDTETSVWDEYTTYAPGYSEQEEEECEEFLTNLVGSLW